MLTAPLAPVPLAGVTRGLPANATLPVGAVTETAISASHFAQGSFSHRPGPPRRLPGLCSIPPRQRLDPRLLNVGRAVVHPHAEGPARIEAAVALAQLARQVLHVE